VLSLMARFVILFVALFALAFAASPSPPSWPSGFSASVSKTYTYSGSTLPSIFYRWFYSEALNKERTDTVTQVNGENAYWTTIINANAEKEWNIYVLNDDEITCYENQFFLTNVSALSLAPQLPFFFYIGQSLVGFEVVNHWSYFNFTYNTTYQYYENTKSRAPVKLDVVYAGVYQTTYSFFEFDGGDQDPSLFVIDPNILQICSGNTNAGSSTTNTQGSSTTNTEDSTSAQQSSTGSNQSTSGSSQNSSGSSQNSSGSADRRILKTKKN